MGRDDLLRNWAIGEPAPDDDETRIDLTQSDRELKAFQQCVEIVNATLGTAWLERELSDRATHLGGFLGFDDEDEYIDPLAMHHLINLALELRESRALPGFPEFVRGLRSRSLVDATAELAAAKHCAERGDDVRFVDPLGSGKSPDLLVALGDFQVAVEVKARAPQPLDEYRPSKILNTLNDARRHIPKSGPGLVYLRVSPPWSQNETVLKSIAATCDRFLANSRRVNAVVLLLERHFPNGAGGMTIQNGSLPIPSANPRIWVPEIQGPEPNTDSKV